jgi:hypothetical protein
VLGELGWFEIALDPPAYVPGMAVSGAGETGVVEPPPPPELGELVGVTGIEIVGETLGETEGETVGETVTGTTGEADGETVGDWLTGFGFTGGAWNLGNALTSLQFLKAWSEGSLTQRLSPLPPSTKSMPLPPNI